MQVCIDDFALKKREKYGTVMVDIETHKMLDMIPSRDADDVAEWLKTYPNLQVVSRDGSITYNHAIAKAHPHAIQVSDRFHLFKNLIDYGKDYLKKQLNTKVAIPATIEYPPEIISPSQAGANRSLTWKEKYKNIKIFAEIGMSKSQICERLHMDIRTYQRLDAIPQEKVETYFLTNSEKRSKERQQQKIEKVKEAKSLHEQGCSKRSIAKIMVLSRATVDKYLAPDFNPIHGSTGQKRQTKLSPYERYIQSRLSLGIMASEIEKEISSQGYKGSSSLFRRYCCNWKKEQNLKREKKSEEANLPGYESKEPQEFIERKHIFKLLYHPVKKVNAITEKQLEHLLVFVPEFEKIHSIIWSFKELVTERRYHDLDEWIVQAEKLEISEIQSYTNGIRRDLNAVQNAIKYEFSNGLAEGTVNKIKVIKRIMYGRCCFETLRIKSLRLEKMRKIN